MVVNKLNKMDLKKYITLPYYHDRHLRTNKRSNVISSLHPKVGEVLLCSPRGSLRDEENQGGVCNMFNLNALIQLKLSLFLSVKPH